MSVQSTTYPKQPASGSIPDLETVATTSNAGETSRSFTARHVDELEGRMRKVPLWLASHSGIGGAVVHKATVAGDGRIMELWHKKGELADDWAARAVHAIARWGLANPADV